MPSTRKRTPASLDGRLDCRLRAYALAASTAGVGLLLTTNSAEAEIVYTETNQQVQFGYWTHLPPDLNNDGRPDFNLS